MQVQDTAKETAEEKILEEREGAEEECKTESQQEITMEGIRDEKWQAALEE